jgi:hypothetical protein
MIENYFDYILSKLNNIEEIKTSSHMPPGLITSVEEELLLSIGYVGGVPPNFPEGDVEKIFGLRRLRKPHNGNYLNMKLRIGISTLHIKDRVTRKNIDSIIICYMGESQKHDISGAKSYSVKEATIINFLDNGVISSCYLDPKDIMLQKFHILSWYPDEKSDYGVLPYPKNKIEVEEKMKYILNKSNTSSDSKAFRSIPDLVMLCTQAYEEVSS